ncbi:hypothetical protein [Nocardiopsis suaedae]|uniref:DUF397 domain-containing protein n=1 Tax=Nocardiopsis suaedae TaxID=3018444 RepID=A0ABT4TJJ6_9ACTN|nr:hypothetical protein [Nocardiopsis suaedae]MDA2804847.1 hypothetical protein [Nocardiopsis suaedae]
MSAKSSAPAKTCSPAQVFAIVAVEVFPAQPDLFIVNTAVVFD